MSAAFGQQVPLITVDGVPLFLSTALLALGVAPKAKKFQRRLLQLSSRKALAIEDAH